MTATPHAAPPTRLPRPWRALVEKKAALRQNLRRWFRKNARDLPWRHQRTPYRVWVSELMLQQTQVATVIPYYLRWMERFPNVERLASAPIAAVLKHWEGLGYYRRARYLHEGAKRIVASGGRFPDTHEALLTLPGVGPYTAGAIASLAFGLAHPVVDGNVERVLLRLAGDSGHPENPLLQKRIWQCAALLLPPRSPGAFNEGLMELGAMVCTPARPDCASCPLRGLCRAWLTKKVEGIPRQSAQVPAVKVSRVAIIMQCRGKVLMKRRSEQGRLGGLWQFPEVEWAGKARSETALHRLLGVLESSNIGGVRRCVIRHSIMNERVTTTFLAAMLENRRPLTLATHAWRSILSLETIAMPIAHRKAARALLAERR